MDINLLGLYQSLYNSGINTNSLSAIQSVPGLSTTGIESLLGTNSDSDNTNGVDFSSILSSVLGASNQTTNTEQTETLKDAILQALSETATDTGVSNATVQGETQEETMTVDETSHKDSAQSLYDFFQKQNATLGGVEQVLSEVDHGSIEELIENQIADSVSVS